jgi:peptidoglycan hydrolase CwlO-like protein
MRKISIIFSLFLVALVGVSAYLYMQNRKASDSLVALQASEEATRTKYTQAIDDIAAIQDSLNSITLTDNGAQMTPQSLTAEWQMSPTHGDEVLARVAELRAGIERARDRIQALESRLHQNGTKINGLQHMVAQLKAGLAVKEQLVAQLSTRVDSLQTNVNGLTATVQQNESQIAEQQATLEERRRELGTVYYTIGTRQDLLKSGVAVARGGLLGIGKTLDPSGKVDEASFQALDTDQQTVIPIEATKARVLTPQPTASYVLEPVEGKMELRILDAKEFRKVRHLVIVKA